MRTNEIQLQRSRELRSKMTHQERKLWSYLRNRHLFPYHFKRQQPIGIFIVDFFCHDKKIIIELDGSQHGTSEGQMYDTERTRFLNAHGYKVIRFWNQDIDMNLAHVLETIRIETSSPMFGEDAKLSVRQRGR